jgi:hypothetical protein
MTRILGAWIALSVTLVVSCARATVLYVDANCNNPVPPYADWDTAATNIQDAVDAANTGDLVLVTNGVYQTGGRTVNGYSLTNRVVIDKALTVQSVNGPEATIIEGYQVPGATNGPNAVRGAYVADGATLNGFTVAYGATIQTLSTSTTDGHAGGIWCQSTNAFVLNCVVVSNMCSRYGAAVYSGTLRGCRMNYNLVRVSGSFGGGAVAFSTITDSTINNNSYVNIGESGAGAYSCTLSNCSIMENSVGGVSLSSLNHCTVGRNTNYNGGGATWSSLTDCLIYGNQSSSSGGGVYNCSLTNCTLSNNWSAVSGGGAFFDFLDTNSPGDSNIFIGNACAQFGGGLYLALGSQNKTWNITGWSFLTNSAVKDGGGLYLTSLASGITNCTFAGNSSGGNGGGFSPSTSGSPIHIRNSTFSGNIAQGNGGGAYNAALDDCFVSENHAANGGGVYGYVSNSVVNGNSALASGGGLYYSNPFLVPCPGCQFTNNSAMNGGACYGGLFTNCIFAGNSAVTNGGGVTMAALSHCLVLSNRAAFGGGAYGATGLYLATQMHFLNCDFIGNFSQMDGGGVYATNFNKGTNCSFIGNIALNNGGGVWGGSFGRGVICNNSALNGGGFYNTIATYYEVVSNTATGNGGGLHTGSLNHCIVSNNVAGTNGGGCYNAGVVATSLLTRNSAANGGGGSLSSFNNSTITGNTASISGGGMHFIGGGSIVSCIIYDNSAPVGSNYSGSASFSYCCTTPLPPAINHNITNDPAFIDFAAANFRLQSNSPCINIGNGPSAGIGDLDGRNRFVGPVDIGAYEFQRPGVGEFIAWLEQHNLPTDGSADFLDSDADGLNNWQEWLAGTEPTISSSVLKLMNPTVDISAGITLTWQSVSNRIYFLQRGADLLAQPPFSTIQSNIIGQAGTTSYTDTNGVGTGPFFYRIGVQ